MKRILLQRAALILTLICLTGPVVTEGSWLGMSASTQATAAHAPSGDGFATDTATTEPAPIAVPQAATIYRREAEAMTLLGVASVYDDTTASGGEAVEAWHTGDGIADTVTAPSSGQYTLSFAGREDYYGDGSNTHAHVSLYLDGATAPIAGVWVTNASGWVSYSLSMPLSAGTHRFSLVFDNDAYGGTAGTDRNVYVDFVTITAVSAPTVTSTPQSALSYRREAEAMTLLGVASVYDDATASGGEAVEASHSGDGIADTVTAPSSGQYTLSFAGREDYYGDGSNTHAHVSLYLDGATAPIAGVWVTNASGWESYSLSMPLSAGTHRFSLVFDNDAYGGTAGTDRNVYVDFVTITTGGAPATSTDTTIASPTDTPTPVDTATGTPPAGHAIQTVFLIVLENHNWSSIKGSASAPYINNTLLPLASYANHYYTPPGNHPSLPNYLWLEAGTNFGITNDNSPATNHQSSTSHLTTLLSAAGLSWKDYQENISGTSCPLTDSYPYAVRHNPMVYFDDQTNNQSTTSATCIAHVRPFSELSADLRNGSVARYNFIVPNVCDDGHDTCAPFNNPVLQADTWLATTVPTILSSQAYRSGGALFITWDEGDASPDGPLGMIVLSPFAKGGGYANSVAYTHSSTLRTLEEIFGVGPMLGDAANATDLRDLFARFP